MLPTGRRLVVQAVFVSDSEQSIYHTDRKFLEYKYFPLKDCFVFPISYVSLYANDP